VQHLVIPHRSRLIALAAVIAGCAVAVGVVLLGQARAGAARFGADVQPIFDAKCVSCHPVSYPYLDLRRGHSYADVVRVSAATRPAFERVVPGKPELSYLLIHPPDPSLRGLLTREDRATIAAWIRAGARDD
jgi:hypothetical protein